MATFLIRDFDSSKGYKEYNPQGGLLPRTNTESYVPWGLTLSQQVVYAKVGEHQGWRGGSGGNQLKPYNSMTSKERRRECQSVFGTIALNNRTYTMDAVTKVSGGVKAYLLGKFWRDQAGTMKCVYDNIGHYFYTNGGSGFGRISKADKKGMTHQQVWTGIIDTLAKGRLDQLMAIHDAVGRKILPVLGGPALETYNHWGPMVRQDWFDDKKRRGRVNQPDPAQETTTGGIVGQSGVVSDVAQARVRGVDAFMRDVKRTSDPQANDYYDDLDTRNLLFGAGISGTTGTLLQAALAFGKLSSSEQLKQYVMAIVGYLVGGGMHSYHETMAVAQKVGVEYVPGGYLKSLPVSFLGSQEFRSWNEKYYDIVTLGQIHWMYNSGVLPSHLNPQLTRV
ncbi:MAG: hypothetical protein MI864_23760 [Pseudomonadales bacterium]|nr:hypothetical protein [Pseudomonadales bacterium]